MTGYDLSFGPPDPHQGPDRGVGWLDPVGDFVSLAVDIERQEQDMDPKGLDDYTVAIDALKPGDVVLAGDTKWHVQGVSVSAAGIPGMAWVQAHAGDGHVLGFNWPATALVELAA